jgi:hypothetical protein
VCGVREEPYPIYPKSLPRMKNGLPWTMSCWARPSLRIAGKLCPFTMDNKAAKPKDSTVDDNTNFTPTSFGTGMQDNSASTHGCAI